MKTYRGRTHDEQRQTWRDRNAVNDLARRRDGRRRVAGWLTQEAYDALCEAKQMHGTTTSQELEAAIYLNLRMRVENSRRGRR